MPDDGEPSSSLSSLGDIISNLGISVVRAQKILDDEMQRDLDVWAGSAAAYEGPGDVSELVMELLPSMQRISETSVSMSLDMTQANSRGFRAGINLLGRPIHTFYQQRFAQQESTHSRIELNCSAAPPFLPDEASENEIKEEES